MRLLFVGLIALAAIGSAEGASQPVSNHSEPAVSANGRLVAYTSVVGRSARGRLVVLTSAGKRARVLASLQAGRNPRWSPDGRWIAFVNKEIYVVSPQGGKPRRLSHEWSGGSGPQYGLSIIGWLDNQTVAYDVSDCCFVGGVQFDYGATVTVGGKQIDHQDEADCNLRTDCVAGPVQTPDGMRDVNVMTNADGSKSVQLSGPEIGTIDLGPGSYAYWSPDNRHLVWLRPDGLYDVTVIADPNGANQHALLWNGVPDRGVPMWSPDASQIVLQGDLSGKQQVFLASADGANLHPVTHELGGIAEIGLGPTWSAHGRWILVTLLDGQTVKTMALARDGTGEHLLVRWRAPYKDARSWDDTWSSLDWGPRDAVAVYDDHVACRATAIYRVNPASGRARRLTDPCAMPPA
jgi:dipeptidyl aminopeptidase/acylaminoacyl peptidase